MRRRLEPRAGALALAIATTALIGARAPVPGGHVTIYAEPGEVGAAVLKTLSRAAAAPRLVHQGSTTPLRVIAPDRGDVAEVWTLAVDRSLDPIQLAAAIAAESGSSSALDRAQDPGLFADVLAAEADPSGRRELTLRFAHPVCSPLLRFAAWSAAGDGLSGAGAPFLAAHRSRFRPNPAWPRAVHLDRLTLTTGSPPAPHSGEVRVGVRRGGGRPPGVFLCRVLATVRGDEETKRARVSVLRRLLDRDAFAPLVSAEMLCPWFTDIGEPPRNDEEGDAPDPREVMEGVVATIRVHTGGSRVSSQDMGGTDGPSALIARRARVLLESAGARVLDRSSAAPADVALVIVSRAFLNFGPAEGEILAGHARGADAAWTALALGLDVDYGADVAGSLAAPETLWLLGPGPER